MAAVSPQPESNKAANSVKQNPDKAVSFYFLSFNILVSHHSALKVFLKSRTIVILKTIFYDDF
ncbi:hypothetical protein ASG97_14550 [Bacillus sp. Soil745]|uniref:hypothetical protein n=1 Tax=Peribacillus frigoritolerans TaxID=450367 RepID=UPI000708C1DD|nr:hypothetical protein [Peribacillus frigoritolerans]KRF49901.1 hypothetical protein ASG97_14550 [Bacillus sp. Soil745]MED3711396.1 hypothetical protein [Peribacillus frigoritolerans]PAW29977.1 hypothetical protein BKC07_07155 [Peribacillus simplex]CAH0143375.1 hypothetical protein SRABI80_00446 [Peribacillus frigoritolerans]